MTNEMLITMQGLLFSQVWTN